MVTINFLGPIGLDFMELNVSNLEELANALRQNEQAAKWLENSSVAINDRIVSDKSTPLQDGDVVSILPPVCGG